MEQDLLMREWLAKPSDKQEKIINDISTLIALLKAQVAIGEMEMSPVETECFIDQNLVPYFPPIVIEAIHKRVDRILMY